MIPYPQIIPNVPINNSFDPLEQGIGMLADLIVKDSANRRMSMLNQNGVVMNNLAGNRLSSQQMMGINPQDVQMGLMAFLSILNDPNIPKGGALSTPMDIPILTDTATPIPEKMGQDLVATPIPEREGLTNTATPIPERMGRDVLSTPLLGSKPLTDTATPIPEKMGQDILLKGEPTEGKVEGIKVYHGTTKQFEKAQANMNYETDVIDRWLGVHYAESPEIAKKFSEDKGRVIEDIINPKTVYDLPQKTYKTGILESDQMAFQRDIQEKVFLKRPELMKEYLKRQNYTEENINKITASPETIKEWISGGQGLVVFGKLGETIKNEYLGIMKELGYESIRYQNTAPMETEGIKNVTSYVKLSTPTEGKVEGLKAEAVKYKSAKSFVNVKFNEWFESLPVEEKNRIGNDVDARMAKFNKLTEELTPIYNSAREVKPKTRTLHTATEGTQREAMLNAGKFVFNNSNVTYEKGTVWSGDSGATVDQMIKRLEDRANIPERWKSDPEIVKSSQEATRLLHELKMNAKGFTNYQEGYKAKKLSLTENKNKENR